MITNQSQSDIPSDRALRGRRLSAAEFKRITGRELRSDNDNKDQCPDHNATTASR
jgi:hypothetical protein